MTTRTSTRTVTFKRPFLLDGFDEAQPAGDYSVETDEELLEGLSFPAYRRTQTFIQLHARPAEPGVRRAWRIDPKALDAALERDRAAAEAGARDIERARTKTIAKRPE